MVVDATTGNGKDCLFLSTIVKKGFVFGFDIQEEAINKTTNLLNKNNIKNYQLFLNDHQNIDKILNKYKNKISLVVYNLGYLPKSKSNIMTKKESTINSIKASLKLLNNKGFILVVAYPHDEGKKEKAEIYKLRKYNYIVNEYKNTTNDLAPVLLEIKKQSCHITPQLTEI
ncbi:MAG: class I SAM-dependent methyltransferase [bacterium]|nr:class I SAM-dependent methyltransferase [bacterium]